MPDLPPLLTHSIGKRIYPKIVLWMIVALGIWLAAFLIGYHCSRTYFDNQKVNYPDQVCQTETELENEAQLLRKIVVNNLKVISINFTGIGTLGFSTTVNLFSNGYLAGNIVSFARWKGLPVNEILGLILPHSIELLAFWLSGGIGLALGFAIFKSLKGIYPHTSEMILFLLLSAYSYLLTLLAGLCEVYITMRKI